MSDMRRIELSSVKTSEKEPKVKRKVKTVRLVLSLGESNATSCPEYSFADLVKTENDKNGASLDPFGDNDEEREVAAIAQRFEAKYGTKSFKSSRKRQTQDMDDYFDVGDGYDEDDPFIDNTEAYDEVVPSTLTTKYGGFYINQGKLDFKSISDDSNDSFVVDKSKKKNKRKIIESDSDDETPEAIAKKFKAMKRKKLLEGREAEKKKKKLSSSMNGDVSILKKKKKKNLLKMKMSREEPHIKDSSSSVSLTPKQTTASSASVVTATTAVATPAPATVTVSTVTSSQPSVSSVNGAISNEEGKDIPEENVMKEPGEVIINVDDSSSKSGDEEKKAEATSEEKNTQLPTTLPQQLADDIAEIKRLAKINTEGKSKFFSGKTNKLLLAIENESFNLPKSHRSAIFHHLAEHLPTSGKTALLRRAKKLRQAEHESPLKEPMDKLREAVKLAMPKAIEDHQQIIAKARLEAKQNGADTTTEDAATESDEDESNKTTDTKKTRMPRRKFSWTPEIIELFLKVVEVKMGIYGLLKVKSQPPDEYLKAFLEAEVKPIWPNNWMNTRALLKLHREETSKGVKSKKNVSGKGSPVPPSDALNQSQQLVSKTDTVVEIFSKKANGSGGVVEDARKNITSVTDGIIEISSIIDDEDVEEKKNVVVNLPGSDVKSTFTTVNLQPSQARSSTPTSSNVPPSKSSSSSTPASDHLYNAVKKFTDKSGMGNTPSSPIMVPESPKMSGTPVRMGTVISTPVPKSASTPVLTGSNVNPSGIPLNNRSFLQALDSPSLQQGGPLPSKPQLSLLSPHQQQKAASSILNSVAQALQPQQQKQPQQKKLQLPSSTSKTGSNISLLSQPPQQQQKIRPSKETKLTVSQQKNTSSSYPSVVNNKSDSGTATNLNKDLLINATPSPTNPMPVVKPSLPLLVTKGGTTSPSQLPAYQANKVAIGNNNQPRQQPIQSNHTAVSLSTQQQQQEAQQKQHPSIKPPQPSQADHHHHHQAMQATIVSPPNTQTGRKPGLASVGAGVNASPINSLTNTGGAVKQSPSRQLQQQQQKSPSVSSPYQSSNYLVSKNNQFALNNKSGVGNVLSSPSSSSFPAGAQVKSGIVLGTTLPKFKQNNNSGSRGNTSATSKPLSIQTSVLSSSNLSPSSLFSASRTSTPSPQKSPGSPGTTASSLFDQIQSQIMNQEATQEQGLKVLAMALNTKKSPNT